MTPKICLISRRFDEQSGRCEWIYAQRLKDEMEKRGIQVFTIEQKDADLDTPKTKKLLHDLFIIPFKLLKLRFKNNVKIFHFLNENQAVYSWLVNLTGAETISTFHDFLNLKSKNKKRKIYFKIIYRLASLSRTIVCNSQQTKKEFEDIYGLKKRIEIIPVINYSIYPLNKQKKRSKIGFLGVREPRKNVLEFVKLAELIKKDKPNLEIELWGAEGSLDKELRKQIRKKNLDNILKIKGIAPSEKINEIYNSFDFLFSPTKEEGLGVALIEPMFCGVPVFVLKNSKIPDEVKKNCIVCKGTEEVYEKILEFNEDRRKYNRLRKKIIENSKKFKEFSAEYNFNRLADLYRSLHERF